MMIENEYSIRSRRWLTTGVVFFDAFDWPICRVQEDRTNKRRHVLKETGKCSPKGTEIGKLIDESVTTYEMQIENIPTQQAIELITMGDESQTAVLSYEPW